jgi:hypothetical protein
VLRDKPAFALITSRSLIFWECSFPLALLAPAPIAYAFIGTCLVFHPVNAYVMGLNTFLFRVCSDLSGHSVLRTVSDRLEESAPLPRAQRLPSRALLG